MPKWWSVSFSFKINVLKLKKMSLPLFLFYCFILNDFKLPVRLKNMKNYFCLLFTQIHQFLTFVSFAYHPPISEKCFFSLNIWELVPDIVSHYHYTFQNNFPKYKLFSHITRMYLSNSRKLTLIWYYYLINNTLNIFYLCQ